MKKEKKVIIIRGSSLERETRATKIIKTLTENDYNVHLLWWDRGTTCQRSERVEGGTQYSDTSFQFKAPYGPMSLIFLPFWWFFIFYHLMRKEWDTVHVIQVISLPPAICAGKIKKRSIIYDMLDTYEDSISLPISVRNFCVTINKTFMRLVDAVILADEEQIQEVNGIPNDNVVAIYDSPFTHFEINKYRPKNSVFTLFFAGALQSDKYLNLDKIICAIHDIDRVKLIIAGFGDLVPQIKEAVMVHQDKIEFIGEISHAEVLQRSADADLLFILRDPLLLVNRFICGSKILEAMMCETPIMVSKGTSTANIVQREQCGIVVDPNNISEIYNAIIKIQNDSNYQNTLRKNAKNAYNERYSWKKMEDRLLKIYCDLC